MSASRPVGRSAGQPEIAMYRGRSHDLISRKEVNRSFCPCPLIYIPLYAGLKSEDVVFHINSGIKDTDTRAKPIKIHIAAYKPFTSDGGGLYSMSYVKQIETSSDFNEMSAAKKKSQNLETIDECSNRKLNKAALEDCNCVPWEVSVFEDINEGNPLCSPLGKQCFVDFFAARKNTTSMCEVSCEGLYLDVEHIKEEMELPMDEFVLSEETWKLFEEYKHHRNGNEQLLLDIMEDFILDKTGWPFNTTQNKRVPYITWSCLGPSQPAIPDVCYLDDINEHLKIYCESFYESISLKPEDCQGTVDERISKMCQEKQLFWETEEKCKNTKPRNMDRVMWEECRCSKTRLEDIYTMQQSFLVVKIYFDTASFEKVIKSAKTNFVSQLSLIGGTLGLFTGFSLLSGMEILFFFAKTLISKAKESFTFKKPTKKKKQKLIIKA